MWSVFLHLKSLGLAVALVVKYADNIHKGFASAIAIVLSGLLESRLFPHSFDINMVFIIGSALVLLSSIIFVLITRREHLHAGQHPVGSEM